MNLFSESLGFEAVWCPRADAVCTPQATSRRFYFARGLVWGCRSRRRGFWLLVLPGDVPIGGRGGVGVVGG